MHYHHQESRKSPGVEHGFGAETPLALIGTLRILLKR